MTDEVYEQMVTFLKALNEAERDGKKEFVCPLCGGIVVMRKAESNGHVHAYCNKCFMEVHE